MKIGLFTTWLSQTAGGIENMCYNVFMYLRKTHDVKAYSLLVDQRELLSEDVFYASTSRRTVPFLQYIREYRNQNKKESFDVNIAMHVATGVVPLIIKLFYKTPYIVCVYAKEINYYETVIHRIIYTIVLRHALHIIAISHYTASLCDERLANKISIIHPGLNEKIVLEAGNVSSYENNKAEVNLFTIGRLVKRKGVDTTIFAVKELINAGYNVRYTIAGDGEYADELKKLVASLYLSENIIFLGRISEEEKSKRFSECDIFVMPSYEIPEDNEIEGFGIVYIEANAFGKLVVAGNSGGISDAVKNDITGYMVDGTNPNAVKNAIVEYLSKTDDEKHKLYHECKSWAMEHDWAKLINKWHKAIGKTNDLSATELK